MNWYKSTFGAERFFQENSYLWKEGQKTFIYFLASLYKATIEKVSAKMHWTEQSLEKTSNLRVFEFGLLSILVTSQPEGKVRNPAT